MKAFSYLNGFGFKAVNTIISSDKKEIPYLFATRNKNKLAEYQRILKKNVEGVDLKVPEIQEADPQKVLEEKAKAAYLLNSGPIYVEDSSLTLTSLDNMIGPFADNETNTRIKLEAICRMYATNQSRSAVMSVGIALFDGVDVYTWIGEVKGKISQSPLGSNGFGFDPIFIPNGVDKTNAELSDRQKDAVSARRLALEKLQKNPPKLQDGIFQLQEPSEFQLARIQKKELIKNKKAVRYAFSLESLQKAGQRPNNNFLVEKYAPFFWCHITMAQ